MTLDTDSILDTASILEELRRDATDLAEKLAGPGLTDAEFWGAQFDAGLSAVEAPVGLGGRGIEFHHQELVDEVLADAPRNVVRNLIGVQMVAPTLVAFGTRDQQQAYLRRAYTCEDIWCQLFSEPGAGSDLAALSTRAVADGDDWVVDGQKVWTTLAHVADYGFLIARTDPDVPKHKGLTAFIVDMRAEGVEVRPLRQVTGEAEYNEVFLDGVRIPDSRRLGPVGEGWRVGMSTLMNERAVMGSMSRGVAMEGLQNRALEVWRSRRPGPTDAVRRDQFVRLWEEAEVLRLTAERAEALRKGGQPGPEGSISKIAYGQLSQRMFSMLMDLRGPEANLIDHYEQLQPDVFTHVGGEQDDSIHLTKAFLVSLALTIAGGTTEVNKNVLGERVLGLPPEPREDRSLPWSKAMRDASPHP